MGNALKIFGLTAGGAIVVKCAMEYDKSRKREKAKPFDPAMKRASEEIRKVFEDASYVCKTTSNGCDLFCAVTDDKKEAANPGRAIDHYHIKFTGDSIAIIRSFKTRSKSEQHHCLVGIEVTKRGYVKVTAIEGADARDKLFCEANADIIKEELEILYVQHLDDLL